MELLRVNIFHRRGEESPERLTNGFLEVQMCRKSGITRSDMDKAGLAEESLVEIQYLSLPSLNATCSGIRLMLMELLNIRPYSNETPRELSKRAQIMRKTFAGKGILRALEEIIRLELSKQL
ncbi:hypothetical protein AVEN_172784-1 [Araneus ventricosus]|uniref:Uncharacterized protein n=1 Tax=Araneus ventricosus TaxID=182803 RepID=A0A4Y2BJT4_ARAVE|nr:hypothetical protein AVEN_172784-1 [Araneus ventricosus]